MYDLKGKVALVTGAASGIGFAYVKELLRNQLKAVALIDVDVKNGERAVNEVLEEFGKDCAIFVKADVSDKKQLEEAFETVVKTFEQLDIVINNAGIIQELDWVKCVSVNLIGVITGCMLAIEKYLPKYKSGPEGVIVNTASLAGLMPVQELPTYAATKFGVVGLTGSLGGDFRYENTKVRVVAICPGAVLTPIFNVNESQLNEPYLSRNLAMFDQIDESALSQKPEDLAKSVMGLIKEAPTGSVWIAKDGKSCTKVEFPNYFS